MPVGKLADGATGPDDRVAHVRSLRTAWCSQKTVDGKFRNASQEDMRFLFQYLEGCLGKIVQDNELGALEQALSGGYVEPGPGGDPIRCGLSHGGVIAPRAPPRR